MMESSNESQSLFPTLFVCWILHRVHLPVVLSDISMMHLESRLTSRELNGRTRTATLTDDMIALFSCAYVNQSHLDSVRIRQIID